MKMRSLLARMGVLGTLAVCTALAAPVATQVAAAGEADPWRYVWRVTKQPKIVPGLDCTFFKSQAFNQDEAHYSHQMAVMCEMLSDYKKAVITSNSIRYRADYIARETTTGVEGNPVPEGKHRDLPIATDSGKYLIARELGLIEALGTAQTSAKQKIDTVE